tara:strand:+ start:1062 stop:1754 length:693 start_codon:yes stop_codon:yes gene_type:complete
MLPKPVIEKHGKINVVRDDFLEGGTKMRFILPFIQERKEKEFVYASPSFGYAQVALASCCKILNKKAVIFSPKRKEPHLLTLKAKELGATIYQVPYGYLSNIQSKAKKYCINEGAFLIPFGVDIPTASNSLTNVAKSLNIRPKEVWTVSGSGTLTRALQKAWTKAKFYAVEIGKKNSDIGNAIRLTAPEKYEQKSKLKPPFPSSLWYDAKCWQFIIKNAKENALFWNVGS